MAHLAEAAKVDTIFRDLYIHRGRFFLNPLLSPQDYEQLKHERNLLNKLVAASGDAVEKGDWEAARKLAADIHVMKQKMTEVEGLATLAKEIYEPDLVVMNPFSPGMGTLVKQIPATHAMMTDRLKRLAETDAVYRSLYENRAVFFQGLPSAAEMPASPETIDVAKLKKKALQATEQGDVDSLNRTIAEMTNRPEFSATSCIPSQKEGSNPPSQSKGFPGEAIRRSEEFGFARVTVEPAERNVTAFFRALASEPSYQQPWSMREGGMPLSSAAVSIPEAIPDAAREFLNLFTLHPFINSAGVRYLPQLVHEELLAEDFPENLEEFPQTELLRYLHLETRRGLSRDAIERALLQYAISFIDEALGLDPVKYRLTCIPPDLYCRAGCTREWGLQKLWTHFDGYQVLKDGGFRALVGGDSRYGGLHDLCSINPYDAREGVIVRFAVVQRERFMISCS